MRSLKKPLKGLKIVLLLLTLSLTSYSQDSLRTQCFKEAWKLTSTVMLANGLMALQPPIHKQIGGHIAMTIPPAIFTIALNAITVNEFKKCYKYKKDERPTHSFDRLDPDTTSIHILPNK